MSVRGEVEDRAQVSTRDLIPLSFAQQRLWFLDRLEPGSPVYNISFVLDLEGPLNIAALEWSLSELLRRHEAIRTVFPDVGGEPYQLICPPHKVTVHVDDLSGLPEPERMERMSTETLASLSRPFDLGRGPLFRAHLVRLDPHVHTLVGCIHHIVSDGWSSGIMFRELATLYEAFCEERPSPLPELPLQYPEFARRQREQLEDAALARQLVFWKHHLRAPLPRLELPTDHPRPVMRSSRGAREQLILPQDLVAALEKISRERRATLYMTFLAVYAALLHRYTGQDDLIIGMPVASRTSRDIEGLIGFFINTLPLRLDVSRDPSFDDLLNQAKDVALNAFANQDVPFEKLVDELQPERSSGHTPIFETVLNFHNMPLGERNARKAAGLTMRRRTAHTDTTKFDLTTTLTRGLEGFGVAIEYSHELFDRSTILRMLGHFQELLESVAEEPATSVSRLRLLTSKERREIEGWACGPTPSRITQTVADLFEERVALNPDADALLASGETLTYGQLNTKANRLAHELRRLGVQPDARVGICLDRSVDLIVALLAVLKADGAYVPLDGEDPPERLSYLMHDAGVRFVLTTDRFADRIPARDLTVVRLNDLVLDVAGADGSNLERTTGPESLAYVMYTSGSTGRPKGVAIAHRGIVRLVKDVQYVDIRPTDVFLHLAPTSFDASTFEIWGALLNGAKLAIMAGGTPTLHELGDTIQRDGVTILWLTSAFFRQVVDEKPEIVAPIRQLLTGGDVMPVDQVRKLLDLFPACRVVNGYGPTECTTFACCHDVDRNSLETSSIPIGRPIAHTEALVLDRFQQLVPIGVPGELYLGGAGLAVGYVGSLGLTTEKFVPHPFVADSSRRLYRTGDLVRRRPDGALEFLGRTDRQIKLRGFRIELDEVEVVLRQDPLVRDAVVVKDERTPGEAVLVAYVTLTNPAASGETLREGLRERLPGYMIPSVIIVLNELPLTATGKFDRLALPDPEFGSSSRQSEKPILPRTAAEEAVTRIWRRVLGVDAIGVRDDFFELGGHSLLAVRLMAEIEREFDVRLPLTTLFGGGTIEKQARLVEKEFGSRQPQAGANGQPDQCIVPIQPEGTRRPLYLVHGIGGDVVSFGALARLIDRDQPVFGVRSPDDTLIESIEQTASRYLAVIRQRDPNGPYLLGGYSAGGAVAYEMAQQLVRSGSGVIGLIALDSGAPGFAGRRRPLTLASGSRAIRNAFWWMVDDEFLRSGWAEMRKRLMSKVRALGAPLARKLGLDVDLDIRDALGLWRMSEASKSHLEAYLRALRAYRPEPYPGRVRVLRSRTSSLGIPPPDDFNWSTLARGGVEVKIIRGDHDTILRAPRVAELAAALDESLRAAHRETGR